MSIAMKHCCGAPNWFQVIRPDDPPLTWNYECTNCRAKYRCGVDVGIDLPEENTLTSNPKETTQ